MNVRKLILSVIAVTCVACNEQDMENSVSDGGQKVNVCFTAEYPDISADTKVVLDGQNLAWIGEETATLIFGIDGKNNSDNPTIPSVAPGVFKGEITLPSGYKMENLRGIVVPGNNGANFRGDHNTNKARIRMYVDYEQIQDVNGKHNPKNVPFFAELKQEDITSENGVYTISGKTLKAGCSLIRFKIYGKHAETGADEIFRSLRIDASDRLANRAEYNIGTTGTGYNSNGGAYASVSLTEELAIADKTEDNYIEMYLSVVHSGSRTINSVTVMTDEYVYSKDVKVSLPADNTNTLDIYQAILDLSTFRREKCYQFSNDNGKTWTDALPSTFTTLAVRTGNGFMLKEKHLADIYAGIQKQSAPVELDLSLAQYESATFPAVFKGTAEQPDTRLKSIAFPSNVTEIAANAFFYCRGLESVDLTGIQTINTEAFYASGLVHLVVPSSVTSMPGQRAFDSCPNLTTLYYDAKAPQVGNGASSGGINHYHFGWTKAGEPQGSPKANDSEANEKYNTSAYPLTVTIGPNCVALPKNMFRWNHKLTKVTYLGSPTHSWYAFLYAGNIETIDLSGIATPPAGSNKATFSCGQLLDASVARRVIVPAASVAAYKASSYWGKIIEDGYIITSGDEVFDPIVASGPGNMVGHNILPEVASMIEATTVDGMPMAIAHRGCWFKESDGNFYINENNLEGVRMAKRFGYTGIECDVKKTKDGVMILMHDSSLNRTCRNASDYSELSGTVKVADLNFADLRSKYVLESSDPNLREQIPTLEEFLMVCKEEGMIPMLHSAVHESYELAQQILGNKWIAFSGYDNVKKAREVSDCLVLFSSDEDYHKVIAMTTAIGGWCGISSMKNDLYDAEYIKAVRNAGLEIQASIFKAPHERRAQEDGITIQLTDFWWHQNKGLTPAESTQKEYASLANGSSWTWNWTKTDFQAAIVRVDFVGTIKIAMPGGRSYTLTNETRGDKVIGVRLYDQSPNVTITSTADNTSVAATVEIYNM